MSGFSTGTQAQTIPSFPGAEGAGAYARGGHGGDVYHVTNASGGRVLTYYTPFSRADVTGDWSAFTGRVNVTTDASGVDFRVTANYSWPGLGQATVNLADKATFRFDGILNSGAGTFIDIGELSGGPLSTLLGGSTGGRNFTYTLGAKTAAGSEAVFAGFMAEQNAGTTTNYVKTGAGI